MLSLNYSAYRILQELLERPEFYNLKITNSDSGATIIDAGIHAKGGYLTGRKVVEVCLGGLGKTNINIKRYGSIYLPTIFVYTDHPAIATLASQFAGWRVKHDDYYAMGSGPARALALKPRKLYEALEYREEADVAVLVLESNRIPPEEAIQNIADKCDVDPRNLYLILTPTSSLTGAVQISGRVVETGIHRMSEEGLDPKCILHACGSAPIPPTHPKGLLAMGWTNDAILYGGIVYLTLHYEDEERLKKMVEASVSSASDVYGKPFYKIFEEADYDFYKIDPKLFAPATILINNLATGRLFHSGSVNNGVLIESFKMLEES